MTRHFSTLVVGGPLAGQHVAQPQRSFEVATFESCDSAPVTTRYEWQHIGPSALWIHESLDLNTALNETAVTYSEKHHAA